MSLHHQHTQRITSRQCQTSLHLHVTSFQGWTNMQISPNIWLGALSHRILHGTVVPAGSQQVLPGIQSKAANAASLMIACRTIAGVSFSHTDAKMQNSLPFLKTSKIEAQTVACRKFLLIDTKSHWLSGNFCRLLAKRSWVCLCAFHQKGFASVPWFRANPVNVPPWCGPEDP